MSSLPLTPFPWLLSTTHVFALLFMHSIIIVHLGLIYATYVRSLVYPSAPSDSSSPLVLVVVLLLLYKNDPSS